jgi:hypothetical protein
MRIKGGSRRLWVASKLIGEEPARNVEAGEFFFLQRFALEHPCTGNKTTEHTERTKHMKKNKKFCVLRYFRLFRSSLFLSAYSSFN